MIVISADATTYVGLRLVAWGLVFPTVCAASILAATALALRFARTPTPVLDALRDDAYGMYLVHYAFVAWLQYALLSAGLPGAAKGVLVFVGATVLSWSLVAALRRIPAVARIV